MSSVAPKARVLCLHGYRQTGAKLRVQTGALRKGLKSVVSEWVYADGPVVVPFEPEKLVTTDGGLADSASSSSGDGAGAGAGASGRGTEPAAGPETRAWFSAVPAKGSTALTDGEDGPAAGDETKEDTSSEPVNYEVDGLWESLDWLAGYVDEHGPFDGVMGFSQGACMAALLALVRDIDVPPFKFLISVAGFEPRTTDAKLAALLDRTRPSHDDADASRPRCGVPSLHVFGTGDEIIDSARSERLAAHFVGAKLVPHSGGHYVPTVAAVRAELKAFIGEQMRGGDTGSSGS